MALRTDANHATIAAIVRQYGGVWHDTSQMRPSIGFDAIVAYDGSVYLCEVKADAKSTYTPKEKVVQRMYQTAGVRIWRLETPDDVAAMLFGHTARRA
jgi:hypothetical protein